MNNNVFQEFILSLFENPNEKEILKLIMQESDNEKIVEELCKD